MLNSTSSTAGMARQLKRGMNTREYGLFQSEFASLSSGIAPEVETVAAKALEKKLISANNLAEAKNTNKIESERASRLASLFLGRIDGNSDDFYVILDIFKSVPTLGNLVGILQPQTAQSSVVNTCPPPLLGELLMEGGSQSIRPVESCN